MNNSCTRWLSSYCLAWQNSWRCRIDPSIPSSCKYWVPATAFQPASLKSLVIQYRLGGGGEGHWSCWKGGEGGVRLPQLAYYQVRWGGRQVTHSHMHVPWTLLSRLSFVRYLHFSSADETPFLFPYLAYQKPISYEQILYLLDLTTFPTFYITFMWIKP